MAGVKALEILSPGPLTTVQDLGRFGYGRYGVPQSGALDAFALRVGNLLVGNAEGDAGLEMTFIGITARVLTDFVVAITGADLQPALNGVRIEMWRSHRVGKGDILSLRTARSGCRAYLACGGGIDLPPLLGSRSTNLGSGFGGLSGRALRKGDFLALRVPESSGDLEGQAVDQGRVPLYEKRYSVRVIPGPHDDHFSPGQLNRFFRSEYQIAPESDRTGIRLAGPSIKTKMGYSDSIISEGIVPGSVQVPGDGRPIILLNETVTGGYRKIATVIAADLPSLGQAKPGDLLRFRPVSLREARAALRGAEKNMAAIRDELTRLRRKPGPPS